MGCAIENEIINPRFTSASEKRNRFILFQYVYHKPESWRFEMCAAFLQRSSTSCLPYSDISPQGRLQSTEVSIRSHSWLTLRSSARSARFPHQCSQCYASWVLLKTKLCYSFFHYHCFPPREGKVVFFLLGYDLLQLVCYQLCTCITVHGVDAFAFTQPWTAEHWHLTEDIKPTRISNERKEISYLQLFPIWFQS